MERWDMIPFQRRIFLKIIRLLSIACAILICISCSIRMDDLENAKIYTTIYPINYITTYLYSDYSEISSIYPKDSDPATYKLNDAQYNNYSKADLKKKKKKLYESLRKEYQKYLDYQKEYYKYNFKLRLK